MGFFTSVRTKIADNLIFGLPEPFARDLQGLHKKPFSKNTHITLL